MKNILFLIGSLKNGGAERSIVNVANEMSKYHNVILVSASKECDYNCNVKIVEIKEFKHKIIKIIGIYKLYRLKKDLNIDITISYTTAYNFYNVITKYKDKAIISIRNYLSVKKEGFKANLLHKLSLLLCDKIVCCSKSVKFDQINNYKANEKKISVIPNFCDENIIYYAIKNKLYDDSLINDKTIISMARLVPHKGHQYIIEAMKLVVQEIKDAKLLIFGQGPMKEELKKLIKKNNLQNNVILMGFIPLPYAYIQKSKCFILTSLYEGFPNVIIEAMACKVPVIATDSYGGSKEILTDKNIEIEKLTEVEYGILIPKFKEDNIKENTNILKNAIINILTDENKYKYYCKQSKKRVRKYKKELIINKWFEVLK